MAGSLVLLQIMKTRAGRSWRLDFADQSCLVSAALGFWKGASVLSEPLRTQVCVICSWLCTSPIRHLTRHPSLWFPSHSSKPEAPTRASLLPVSPPAPQRAVWSGASVCLEHEAATVEDVGHSGLPTCLPPTLKRGHRKGEGAQAPRREPHVPTTRG